MSPCYVLVHERRDTEDVKFIGVYSSKFAAEAAIDRLRLAPGFRDYLEGFSIDAYEIDQDHWVEGFIDS